MCVDLTFVPLLRQINDLIDIERSTSGICQPGLLAWRTSAATCTRTCSKWGKHEKIND